MPIKKIDRIVIADPNQIDLDPNDVFVVAGFETGVTIMVTIDGEMAELIGTIQTPLTVEELVQGGVNIREAIAAGIIGKLINGAPVYYTADPAYSDFEDEPDHQKGYNFVDGQLDITKRLAVGETLSPPVVNPSAFAKKGNGKKGAKEEEAIEESDWS